MRYRYKRILFLIFFDIERDLYKLLKPINCTTRSAVLKELDMMSDKYGDSYVTGVMDFYKVTNLSEAAITDEQLMTYRDMIVSNRETKHNLFNKFSGGQYEISQVCI